MVMGVIILIIVVLAILGLTVFKARDPKVQINTISLETFSIEANFLYMSLLVDITVHNPNREGFQHSECLTRLFYYGDPVGQATVPAGNIKSKANECFSVRLKVEAGHRVLVSENLSGNIVSGRLPMVATTMVAGIVKVLGVFKHHAVTTSHCDVFIFVANATIQSFFCRHGMSIEFRNLVLSCSSFSPYSPDLNEFGPISSSKIFCKEREACVSSTEIQYLLSSNTSSSSQ